MNMQTETCSNYVLLRGTVSENPRYSHESRGEVFHQFSLDIARLSGTVDTIHILVRAGLLEKLEPLSPEEAGGAVKLLVTGELRTFNNKSGTGPRLIISVFARELRFETGEDENRVMLSGTLCKQPNHRVTPMGREICDLMLAVNRRYGRSDYLPCIVWGLNAREAARWEVGDRVKLAGRIQSRRYTKITENGSVEKTAYEVSVMEIDPTDTDGSFC